MTNTYEICLASQQEDVEGRRISRGLRYWHTHSKYDIYSRIRRREDHNTVAYFVGGGIPDSRDEAKGEFYAAAIIAVFFPVRNLALLRRTGETWTLAMHRLRGMAGTSERLYWIENAQYRHEAEAAARRKRENQDDSGRPHYRFLDDDFDVDSSEEEAQIVSIANSDDKLTSAEQHERPTPFAPSVQSQLYAQHAMQVAERSKIFIDTDDDDAWHVDQFSVQRGTPTHERALKDWARLMAGDVNLQLELGGDRDEDVGDVCLDLPNSSSATSAVIPLNDIEAMDVTDLYPGQQRVLNMISNQIHLQYFDDAAHPLRLLVLGEGGTGKSEVLLRARELISSKARVPNTRFLDNCNNPNDLVSVSAFTGIAASQIGGNTIHREWEICPAQRKSESDINPRALRRLVDRMQSRTWMFIDEISMVNMVLFGKVAQRADKAKAG